MSHFKGYESTKADLFLSLPYFKIISQQAAILITKNGLHIKTRRTRLSYH